MHDVLVLHLVYSLVLNIHVVSIVPHQHCPEAALWKQLIRVQVVCDTDTVSQDTSILQSIYEY